MLTSGFGTSIKYHSVQLATLLVHYRFMARYRAAKWYAPHRQ